MSALLTLIAAVSADGFISRGQGVPWDLPDDRRHFRDYTRGQWLLLGRRTYEEMAGWFSDHRVLVMSRDSGFCPAIGRRTSSVAEALALASNAGAAELVVCGGAQIYALALPSADRLVLTHVHVILGSGAAFPPVNPEIWEPVDRSSHPADDNHALSFDIITYQRIARLQRAA